MYIKGHIYGQYCGVDSPYIVHFGYEIHADVHWCMLWPRAHVKVQARALRFKARAVWVSVHWPKHVLVLVLVHSDVTC
jgi:hypothetical protein